MDSRDSMYEPVEALHVVISCDCQHNLYINVLLIVILVTYKFLHFFQDIFIYILDITKYYFSTKSPCFSMQFAHWSTGF